MQLDLLVKANIDMINGCLLFENGGNYDQPEVEWYRGQIEEINAMITTCKTQRSEKVKEILQQIEVLKVDPQAEFTAMYKQNIEQLSAKDGLGKTYGQPRRFAQERLRSEMTKCENAQKGIDKLMAELEQLCQSAFKDYPAGFDFSKEDQSLSIRIRVTLVSLVRMMMHYGKHLGGFKPVDG